MTHAHGINIRIRSVLWHLAAAGVLLLSHSSWAYSPQSLGSLMLTDVSPRIITPNGDSLNDVVYFKFSDAITGLPVESEILDINGAKVAALTPNTTQTALTWNGRDDTGRVMPSGVYIYFIRIGRNAVNGTIVLAK